MNNYKKMNSYKNSFRNVLMALLGGAMLAASACKKDEPKSAACDIVSFTVNGEAWNINGTDIIHAYPAETAETSLTPAITLSPGATVNPPANAAQNFFTDEGVTYTVTAEDGVAKKTYTVKATRASYTACEIVSFSVNGVAWEIDGTDITHAYPAEAATTNLAPVITLSPGATVNPPSGEEQNFFTDEGVTYTVTAEDGITKKTYTAKATVQAIDFGMTGECIWALTGNPGNYTLIISGNGAMADYGYGESPWYQYRDDIKTAVIQDGVTTIGSYAFDECRGLTSVTIPNSVTTIGDWAFYYCSNLTSVTIPNSVTTIGDRAFYYCSNLTSVTIPNSVTTIGDVVFLNCSGLTAIYVDAVNTQYSSENGVLFNKDKTTLILYPARKTDNSYVIPNSVTTIGKDAFEYCSGLTAVTIPNSVTTIGGGAFGYCSSLTTVTIPNSVTAIGGGAFCYCRGLTAIDVDATNAQYSSENGVLFNKDKTTLVAYPGGKTGGYVIPNSVTTIGDQAFFDCSGLTSVTIPNSVTSIGDRAFSSCGRLTTIHVDAANAQYSSENGVLFNKNKTTLVCCPAGKTGSYVIPNSVTTIGYYAFSDCADLSSVTIPGSVTTIGNYAFEYCSLTTVTIPNSVTTIGSDAFYNCDYLTTVIIGNSVIGSYAFYYCNHLTTVTIGNSVAIIGGMAFGDCNLATVINHNPVPQNIYSSVFYNADLNACTLKVPASAVDDYKAALVWSEFGNIIAISEEDE